MPARDARRGLAVLLAVLVVASTTVDALPLIARQLETTESLTAIPDYVLDYAPYLFFSSREQWWPTDVTNFLPNVSPQPAPPSSASTPATFTTLSTFSDNTYLTTSEDATPDTEWLKSEAGKPNATGYSAAPAQIIVAPKKGGLVDVFYFMFFAYNAGPTVLEQSFGNHVGDWEHVMIRFQDGTPQAIYLSQHDDGEAFAYSAVSKNENRPVAYITSGDHAIYATAGEHIYDTLLMDRTDAGLYWDIRQNYRAFIFDSTNGQFSLPSAANVLATNLGEAEQPDEGVEWLTYTGYWGNEQYPRSDPRQMCVFGHCRYTSGPNGPYLKNLGRKDVCQAEGECNVQQSL